MKQAITGVAPPEAGEVTMTSVWPSIAEYKLGQMIGQGCMLGGGKAFSIGNLVALTTIPVALLLFFWSLRPWAAKQYRLTNRRVVIQRGLRPKDDAAVKLDNFDRIEVDVLPGQEWYPAGDLVFFHGPVEVLRLAGVPHPEAFRQTALKAHRGYVGVKEAQVSQGKQLAAV